MLSSIIMPWHFNPRIPYGMRRQFLRRYDENYAFQSTHPVWDATLILDIVLRYPHFNPRIPYGMRLGKGIVPILDWISIHASRMGCDSAGVRHAWIAAISIHASRMGCDGCGVLSSSRICHFNPRIPYGMRHVVDTKYNHLRNFNPRIPYGMRPYDVSRF